MVIQANGVHQFEGIQALIFKSQIASNAPEDLGVDCSFMYYSQLEEDWKTSFSLPGFDRLIKWLLARLLDWEDPCIKL